MAKALVRKGHQVTIAALHPDFDSLNQTAFEDQGVRVYYVAPMHVRKQGDRKSYYPAYQLLIIVFRATFAFTRIALSTPADIIHIGKPYPMNGLAGLISKLFKKRKLVLDCDDYEAAASHFSGTWQKWFVSFFENHLPHFADLITTHTQFLRERLLSSGIPAERIGYIPNGVDRHRFFSPFQNQINELRNRLGLNGKKVIGYIGSLSYPSHPLDLLIKSFREVLQKLPEALLLIVGGGETFDLLKMQTRKMGLENYTRFCGRIHPDHIPLYYHLLDVSVDPVHDNEVARARCPLKLFESWASGVPFITGDVGDRSQWLGSPPAGVLVRPGDGQALAQGILALLLKPRIRARCLERGQEQIKKYYWDHLIDDLEKYYSHLV
jgi:glycosyltransferase involved in cell wall biosynthesis